MRARAAAALALLALLALSPAACAPLLDGEQDSLCRRVIPALVDGAGGLAILERDVLDDRTMVVRFTSGPAADGHVLVCRFLGSGLSPKKRVFDALIIDGAELTPSAFFFVTERWLHTQASVAAEPQPRPALALDLARLPTVAPYLLQQGLSALPKMGIYALLAASYALLYGLIGRINLAFGGLAALGGVSATLAIAAFDLTGAPSVPGGLIAGVAAAAIMAALWGGVAGLRIFAPLASRPGQHMLIASAGLMIALEEFLRLSQGTRTIWLPPIFTSPMTLARGAYDVTVTPMALATAGVAALIASMLMIWLKFSRFGRDWRAVADDATAAELFGVSPRAVLVKTFALAAALAGVAGVMVVTHYGGMGFAGGAMLGLTALVAAILGGVGSIAGAMAGGCVIGLAEATWSAVLPIEYKDAAVFALLALLLAVRPAGLFGGRTPGPLRV